MEYNVVQSRVCFFLVYLRLIRLDCPQYPRRCTMSPSSGHPLYSSMTHIATNDVQAVQVLRIFLGLWVCLVATWHQREMFPPRAGDPPHATLPPHPSSGKQTRWNSFPTLFLKLWPPLPSWGDWIQTGLVLKKNPVRPVPAANLHWSEISVSNDNNNQTSPNGNRRI